jgi:hypothetical protein
MYGRASGNGTGIQTPPNTLDLYRKGPDIFPDVSNFFCGGTSDGDLTFQDNNSQGGGIGNWLQ